MTANRRQHPRFLVSNLKKLRGYLEGKSSDFELMTIGTGGCGFKAPVTAEQILPPSRVLCRFEMEDGQVRKVFHLEGQTIYASLLNDARAKILYGIQFTNPTVEIEKLCQDLNVLVGTGLVLPA